jgi:Bacterial protein of unknown function (DUF903)
MKNLFKPALAMMAALFLGACSSPHYKITLRDGREFLTANEPSFSQKTGYYKFRDLGGKDALIRADEVLMLHEM